MQHNALHMTSLVGDLVLNLYIPFVASSQNLSAAYLAGFDIMHSEGAVVEAHSQHVGVVG